MFTVIGERINTTLKKVEVAVAERDAGTFKLMFGYRPKLGQPTSILMVVRG